MLEDNNITKQGIEETENSGIEKKLRYKRKIFIIMSICFVVFIFIIIFALFFVGRSKKVSFCDNCKLCEKSEFPAHCRDELFYAQARKNKDKELCEKISDEFLQYSCISDLENIPENLGRVATKPSDSGGYEIKSN